MSFGSAEHPRPEELLSFADGELSGKESAAIRAHLDVLPYAAAAVALATIAVSVYLVGIRTGEHRVNSHQQSDAQDGSTLDTLLRERIEMEHRLQSQAAEMERVSRQLQVERAGLSKWQALKQGADETIESLKQVAREQEVETAAIRSQNRALEEDRRAKKRKQHRPRPRRAVAFPSPAPEGRNVFRFHNQSLARSETGKLAGTDTRLSLYLPSGKNAS